VIDTCGTDEGTELVGTKTGDLYVGGIVTVVGGTHGGDTTGKTWVDGIDDGTTGLGTIQWWVEIDTCGTLVGTEVTGTSTGDLKVGGTVTVDGKVNSVGVGDGTHFHFPGVDGGTLTAGQLQTDGGTTGIVETITPIEVDGTVGGTTVIGTITVNGDDGIVTILVDGTQVGTFEVLTITGVLKVDGIITVGGTVTVDGIGVGMTDDGTIRVTMVLGIFEITAGGSVEVWNVTYVIVDGRTATGILTLVDGTVLGWIQAVVGIGVGTGDGDGT
jgi:hypothetical protein